MEQLWRQFQTEARVSYELYRKEVGWEAREKERGLARGARVAREMFLAMLMKLSPARRVAFLLALAFALLGAITFTIGSASVNLDLRGLGFLILFVLLGLELSDRVTMKRDLEIARDIQRWLVPETPPLIPGLEIAFTSRPANTVAGDYYDVFLPDPQGQRLLLVIADVAGKSVPAALLMATFQACLRSCASNCDGPIHLADRLNTFACTRSLNGQRFTTAFLAELNLEDLSLHYVNAGHNPPVLRRAAGRLERLEPGGLPFGIDPGVRYDSGATRLEKGDLLLFFTDGLVEAISKSDEEYGDARMLEALATLQGQSVTAIMKGLIQKVDDFSAGTPQYDDITCMVVRVE